MSDAEIRRIMKSKVLMALAIIAIIGFGTAGTALAAGSVRQTTDVFRFDNLADVGDATLVRTNSGVSMTIKSSIEGDTFEFPDFVNPVGEFMPGDAVTNWFVVFNNPGNCSDGTCGEDDIIASVFGGDPLDVKVDALFATGHVTGSKWRAAAHLNEGDVTHSIFPQHWGLIDAMAAEIHIIVKSHGAAANLLPGELAEAISTDLGGCITNVCGDPQFAVFMP
jgi:hypothetical protein